VVSKDTLEKIMAVMKHHLTRSQVRAIIAELNEVPGNKSFRDTVKACRFRLEGSFVDLTLGIFPHRFVLRVGVEDECREDYPVRGQRNLRTGAERSWRLW
jgi:hypothetical protein